MAGEGAGRYDADTHVLGAAGSVKASGLSPKRPDVDLECGARFKSSKSLPGCSICIETDVQWRTAWPRNVGELMQYDQRRRADQ